MITAEILTESMLISAYDLRHGHLPMPGQFPCVPTLTFVDSGGYETGTDNDFSPVRYIHKPDPWTLKQYRKILDAWPDHFPAVFVNFDRDSAGKSVPVQIKEAKKLFVQYPKQLHNFLLKPTRKCNGLLSNTLRAAQPFLKEFGSFHVIGVTEKELGHKMLDRMETIARLRRNLDDAGITAPIQVFGALDPLTSCLYCLAGAEIFDGLTWLRFAYSDGQCIYMHNYGVSNMGIDNHDDFVQSKILTDNYSALRSLQLSLRDFVSTKNFDKLSPHTDLLRAAHDSLLARIGGGA